VKSRHIIAIVAIGASLIFIAPTAERAGQAETASEPAQDVKTIPAQDKMLEPDSSDAKLQPASFTNN
jgi:hypothetical protein